MPTLSRTLAALKKSEVYIWPGDVSCCVEKRASRPRFKRKDDEQSVEFTRSAMKVTADGVKLDKINGVLDIHGSRDLPGDPSSCTVMLDRTGHDHISVVVEVGTQELEPVAQAIGVDLNPCRCLCARGRVPRVWCMTEMSMPPGTS